MDTKTIEAVMKTVTIDTKIDGGKIDAVIGERARMDVERAVSYIKSGEEEIKKAVREGKVEFNSNAQEKTADFDQNAIEKTQEFNQNAVNKTGDFNDNFTDKKNIIDGLVGDASNYADLAKQWAIGDPTEPTGNSAKYWAEEAATTLSGLTARVEDIEEVIPSGASDTNQLADKDYVDTADNNLQSQIDALVVASDVFDIVGTYAELQAYDISTVPVNDIIKVLVDSTHSNAATYYRCVETGGVKSWSYIGSEGAYYTKGEADNKFVPQTRTVNSKALSSDITLTASDVGALQSGDNVSELVNDAGYTANIGTVTSVNGNLPDAGGAVTVSGLTIDQTFDGTSTNAQSGTAVAGLLEAIYPVGSVYIGTQATCPMSTVMSGTTWTLVSSGRALWTGDGTNGNTTIAAGLPNITGTAQVAPGRSGYVANGAFSQHATENATNVYASGTQSTRTQYGIGFNASNSNSIYGNSTTVQPPAYVVNVWRRTA